MKKFWVSGVFLLAAGLIFFGKAPAVLGEETLTPVEQSEAYKEYLKKPANDFSKMICLLNYFRTAPVIVQFEGVDYTPEFAYPFGLVYLMTNYRNEKPEHWARKHCYRSIFTNKIIYFKFRDGSSRPARDVIIEKFHELEEAQQKRASKTQSP
jgi:hypothetical protein